MKLNLQVKSNENLLLVPDYRNVSFASIQRKLESLNLKQCLNNICIDETFMTFTANHKLKYTITFHTNHDESMLVNYYG